MIDFILLFSSIVSDFVIKLFFLQGEWPYFDTTTSDFPESNEMQDHEQVSNHGISLVLHQLQQKYKLQSTSGQRLEVDKIIQS